MNGLQYDISIVYKCHIVCANKELQTQNSDQRHHHAQKGECPGVSYMYQTINCPLCHKVYQINKKHVVCPYIPHEAY